MLIFTILERNKRRCDEISKLLRETGIYMYCGNNTWIAYGSFRFLWVMDVVPYNIRYNIHSVESRFRDRDCSFEMAIRLPGIDGDKARADVIRSYYEQYPEHVPH